MEEGFLGQRAIKGHRYTVEDCSGGVNGPEFMLRFNGSAPLRFPPAFALVWFHKYP